MSIVLIQAANFLIQSLFGFFIVLLLLRIILQKARVNFHNPFCQFIVKLTNPILFPFRRVIPGYRGIDFAAIVLVFLLKIIEIYLLMALLGIVPNFIGAVVGVIGELLYLLVYIYMFAIFVQVIVSWVAPHVYRHPLGEVLYRMLEPIMAPARRVLPPISGLDLSPMLVLLLLGVARILIVDPILNLGMSLI